MELPRYMHLLVAKRFLKYLQGTENFELFYKNGEMSYLYGFGDIDYVGDLND